MNLIKIREVLAKGVENLNSLKKIRSDKMDRLKVVLDRLTRRTSLNREYCRCIVNTYKPFFDFFNVEITAYKNFFVIRGLNNIKEIDVSVLPALWMPFYSTSDRTIKPVFNAGKGKELIKEEIEQGVAMSSLIFRYIDDINDLLISGVNYAVSTLKVIKETVKMSDDKIAIANSLLVDLDNLSPAEVRVIEKENRLPEHFKKAVENFRSFPKDLRLFSIHFPSEHVERISKNMNEIGHLLTGKDFMVFHDVLVKNKNENIKINVGLGDFPEMTELVDYLTDLHVEEISNEQVISEKLKEYL